MSQEYFVVKLYTGGYESVFLAFGNKEDVIERLRTELNLKDWRIKKLHFIVLH